MKFLIALGFLIIVFACQSKTTAKQKESSTSVGDTTSFHFTLAQTMDDMVNRMKSISFSGSNDRDFASVMMEYHDGSIDMARLQLTHGEQNELKQFSQAAITGLKQELLMLAKFLKDEPSEQSSSSQKFQQAMNNAVNQMTMSTKFSGPDVDHQYALLMITHHKAGLQMLRAELDYGAHQTMKIDARNMLAKQLDELKWLQSWVSKN